MGLLKSINESTHFSEVVRELPDADDILSIENKRLIEVINNENIFIAMGERIPINFLITPFLLTADDRDFFYKAGEQMHRIIEKVAVFFIDGESVVRDFFSDYLRFLPYMKKRQKYYQVIGRYDFIIDAEGSIKFNEFNASSPGGLVKNAKVNNIVRSYWNGRVDIEIDLTAQRFDRKFTFSKTMNDLEKHSGVNAGKIALLYDNHELTYEFYEMRKELMSYGRDVVIGHVKDVVYKDGYLFLDGYVISLVYNNFFMTGSKLDMSLHSPWLDDFSHHEYSDFLNAVKNEAVLIVHGFAPLTLIEDKRIFALLSDPAYSFLFTDIENSFIEKYIPYTRILSRISRKSDIDYFRSNKDDLVLKKSKSGLGLDIFVGCDISKSDWIKLIETSAQDIVIQEKISSCDYEIFSYLRGNEKYKVNNAMSMYIVQGEYYGMLARLSTNNIVNVAGKNKGVLQPVVNLA